jgi:hypothetical protein
MWPLWLRGAGFAAFYMAAAGFGDVILLKYLLVLCLHP